MYSNPLEMVSFEMLALPSRLLKLMAASSEAPAVVPLTPPITESSKTKFVTFVPRMAKLSRSWRFIRFSDTSAVLFMKTPMPPVVEPSAPVLCWMVPPLRLIPVPVT